MQSTLSATVAGCLRGDYGENLKDLSQEFPSWLSG